MTQPFQGACLCGAITFEITATPTPPTACHCGQCRAQVSLAFASAQVPRTKLSLQGTPTWYRSSPKAERGFCPTCGAVLFWRHDDEDTISFSLGALKSPTGLSLAKHIFSADKGDYYTIADGLPQS